MKTQLLQDIGDSGALPAVRGVCGVRPLWPSQSPRDLPRGRPRFSSPSAGIAAWTMLPPGPAVWRRRRLAESPSTSPPGHTPPPSGAPATAPRPQPASERGPDWLVALMREDAERAEVLRKSGWWKRRLVTWSGAVGVVVLLAAGGLWLLEERRVDGALVVAAETAPAGPAATAPADVPTPAALAPVFPPLSAQAGAPAPARAPQPAPQPAPQRFAPEALPAVPAESAGRTPHARKLRVPKPDAQPARARAMSAMQKQEETFLQCRALGYDEDQCIRRGCAMTRFGLACRG